MKLEQLKERIERTLDRNGISYGGVYLAIYNNEPYVTIYRNKPLELMQPNTDLLLEAVDLECRAIKARQSSATNGIDE